VPGRPNSYDDGAEARRADVVQAIRFAHSVGGVGIACAVHGAGPPLLIDACWLSHLQFDGESPVWRHYLVELGKIRTVIRYDSRRAARDPDGTAGPADATGASDGCTPRRGADLSTESPAIPVEDRGTLAMPLLSLSRRGARAVDV
jgi:hypothetical protein